MAFDALSFIWMPKGVLEQGPLPVIQAIERRDHCGECLQSLRPFREVREQILQGRTHDCELVKHEIGEVAGVCLRVRERQVVRTRRAVDGT